MRPIVLRFVSRRASRLPRRVARRDMASRHARRGSRFTSERDIL